MLVVADSFQYPFWRAHEDSVYDLHNLPYITMRMQDSQPVLSHVPPQVQDVICVLTTRRYMSSNVPMGCPMP